MRWYLQSKRTLPWRTDPTPYRVWVSELMLQQTQVATVIPYFEKWMGRFPDVVSLAEAPLDEVLSVWAGLGYYRRAKFLYAGAAAVAAKGWPVTSAEWERMPGVGKYTAGAIASIAFGEAVALVDGNVERIYARLYADRASGAVLNRNTWDWANKNVWKVNPGDWNQALMELGATVCRQLKPMCVVCPVKDHCAGFAAGIQQQLPTPEPKTPTIKLQHEVWIPVFQGKIGVRRIAEGRWWPGMFEAPRGTKEELESQFPECWLQSIGRFSHAVTHHRISVTVYTWQAEEDIEGLSWVNWSELDRLALPAPMKRAFQMAGPFIG